MRSRAMPLLIRSLMLAFLLGGTMSTASAENTRATAEDRIVSAVRLLGKSLDVLPKTNVVTLGSIGFEYVPKEQKIAVRALVMYYSLWVNVPTMQDRIRKTLAALDDPEIGGLFETGGAKWRFDEADAYLFLVHEHPFDASPDDLTGSVLALERVFPEWSASWLAVVGEIAHGGRAKPERAVTLELNPYRK